MPSCDRCKHIHDVVKMVCPCSCHEQGICKCGSVTGNCMIHKRGPVFMQEDGKFKQGLYISLV